MSQFLIDGNNSEIVSLKENYNKVVFHKQMLITHSERPARMEPNRSFDGKESPGLVRRRVMEMSTLLNGASSPSAATGSLIRPLKRTSSPSRHYQLDQQPGRSSNTVFKPEFRIHGNVNSSPSNLLRNSNIVLAPKPFKSLEPRFDRCSSSVEESDNGGYPHPNNHSQLLQQPQQYNQFLQPINNNVPGTVKQQRSVSFKSCTALTELSECPDGDQDGDRDCNSPPAPPIPKRSASLPRNAHKPVVPPKPRNIAMKMSPTKLDDDSNEDNWSSQVYQLHQSQHIHSQSHEPPRETRNFSQENASRFSGEEDDKVLDNVHSFSFTSPEQHRLEMLKRRQSYSEFEDLMEKKRELRERMLSKIQLLREERDLLSQEKLENDSFGQGITCLLEHYASPQEISKYHQFLEEIEQITKLTVGLNIRLGRLSRKIEGGSKNREELIVLEGKKAKLEEQMREAEFLQQNTDRRRRVIRKMLTKYLNNDELIQYDAFLVSLTKYITELKETEQRIQLGEEQLVALNDNLNISS